MYSLAVSLPALGVAISSLTRPATAAPAPAPQILQVIDADAMDEWCQPRPDLKSLDSTKFVMDMAKPAARVNEFIKDKSDGSENWLYNLEEYVFNTKPDLYEAGDCATVGEDCKPGDTEWGCEDYYQGQDPTDGGWMRDSYWIFRTVQGMHDKLTLFTNEIAGDTLRNSMKVDSMVRDFGAAMSDPVDSSAVWSGFSTGLAITSGLAGFVPGPVGTAASAGAGILSSVMDAFAPEPEERVINVGQINDDLITRYDNANAVIERALQAAVGRAMDEGDYDKLRNIKMSQSNLDQGVSKFLDNPIWLLNNDAAVLDQLFEKSKHYMQLKLVQSVLTAMNLDIVARNGDSSSSKNLDECEGDIPGRRWLEVDGTYYCFGLSYNDAREGADRQEAGADLYATMGQYGVEALSKFYWNAIECARSKAKGESTKPDPSEMVGDLPKCLYSIPVSKAMINYRTQDRVFPTFFYYD